MLWNLTDQGFGWKRFVATVILRGPWDIVADLIAFVVAAASHSPARLRVEALQRVKAKPLSAFVASSAKEARRSQVLPFSGGGDYGREEAR